MENKTKRPHNYYWCMADGLVGMKLKEYTERCDVASETARQWAEAHGADEYIESPNGMAGGIAALIFKNCLGKEGFERIVAPSGDVLFLPEQDSELEKEMYSLPVVSEMELIGILGFESVRNKEGKQMPVTFGDETPVLFRHGECWYVDMPYKCNANGLMPMRTEDFDMLRKEKEQK